MLVTNEDHWTRTKCKQTKGTVGPGPDMVPVLLKCQSGKVKLAVGCADLERGAKARSETGIRSRWPQAEPAGTAKLHGRDGTNVGAGGRARGGEQSAVSQEPGKISLRRGAAQHLQCSKGPGQEGTGLSKGGSSAGPSESSTGGGWGAETRPRRGTEVTAK